MEELELRLEFPPAVYVWLGDVEVALGLLRTFWEVV